MWRPRIVVLIWTLAVIRGNIVFAHYLMKFMSKLWQCQNFQIQKIASTIMKKTIYINPIFLSLEGSTSGTKSSAIVTMELFDILPTFSSTTNEMEHDYY